MGSPDILPPQQGHGHWAKMQGSGEIRRTMGFGKQASCFQVPEINVALNGGDSENCPSGEIAGERGLSPFSVFAHLRFRKRKSQTSICVPLS